MVSNFIKNGSTYVDNSKTFESLNAQKRQFCDFTVKNLFSFWSERGHSHRPGHGGKDSGAIGINTILEKDVVLNIAKEILKLNQSLFDNELDIYLTRYNDTLISLSDRGRLAESLNADVFVSLHCNASQNFSKGTEVYVHNSDSTNSKESIALGVSVLNESTQKLGFKKTWCEVCQFSGTTRNN